MYGVNVSNLYVNEGVRNWAKTAQASGRMAAPQMKFSGTHRCWFNTPSNEKSQAHEQRNNHGCWNRTHTDDCFLWPWVDCSCAHEGDCCASHQGCCLPEISLTSPWKLFILIIKNYIHGIKVLKIIIIIQFWMKLHWQAPQWEHRQHIPWIKVSSIAVLAETSVRSPREIFIFIIKEIIYSIKVSKNK